MKEARDWSLNCDFIYRCYKICGCVLFICICSLKSLQPVDRQLKCELIAIFLPQTPNPRPLAFPTPLPATEPSYSTFRDYF